MTGSRAVIFDLDDTLYPEADFVRSGFRAVAQWGERSLGLPEGLSYRCLVDLFETGVRGTTFDVWLARSGRDTPDFVADAVEVYRNHVPDIAPFAVVPGLLRRLRTRYLLGVVTDGPWQTQQRKLAALGIADLFGAVVFTDALGPGFRKPSPTPFLEAVRRLGVGSDDAWYVADNAAKDFLGARRAGLKTIWFRYGAGIYAGTEPPGPEYRPDLTIECLSVLESVLDGGGPHQGKD